VSSVLAIAIFIAVFAIATWRDVHLGVLMFAAACAVGVTLAGMPLRDVVGGFPVSILILLAGVTYFFGIAQSNGTIDAGIEVVLARAGTRPVALPFVFFVLAGAVAAMGGFPPAGDAGLGADHARRLRPVATTLGIVAALGVVLIATGWWTGPLIVTTAAGAAAVGVLAMRKIGGLTGDVLGAIEQVVECLVLVTVSGLASRHALWWA